MESHVGRLDQGCRGRAEKASYGDAERPRDVGHRRGLVPGQDRGGRVERSALLVRCGVPIPGAASVLMGSPRRRPPWNVDFPFKSVYVQK